MIIMIMGVSGCGKSTVGKALADRLNLCYEEADSFHPKANIDKMSQGEPLDDADRKPWLDRIKKKIDQYRESGGSAVFSCSALKESYRQILSGGEPDSLEWVYLKGSYDLLTERMENRDNHFFKKEMLRSQLDTLEVPEYGLHLDIAVPFNEKIDYLEQVLRES
ncbi:MAG: gluconokinase [Spirochaetales bacterium]|nr:gluconokinase [Spirochaetales bacterium]